MKRGPASAVLSEIPAIWGEVVAHAENRSALLAVRRLGKSLTSSTPLFIHGPPGVGKSALVQQLIHSAIEANPSHTIQVLPANEFPKSPESDSPLADFLNADLLVVEDLQHLPVRDAEAMAKLLDQRSARRRATLCTSTLGPAMLHAQPRRLTTRLAAGLVVRLDLPGLESRRELTEHLALRKKVPLAPDTIDWIAAQSAPGVRTILGLLEKLKPLAKRYPLGITKAQALAWLAETGNEPSGRRPTILERIVSRVCAAFRVKAKDVTGASRLRAILLPRQVAMYLASRVGKVPLTRIGSHFGGRDHTTVLHAVRKVEATMKEDTQLARVVKELRAEVL